MPRSAAAQVTVGPRLAHAAALEDARRVEQIHVVAAHPRRAHARMYRSLTGSSRSGPPLLGQLRMFEFLPTYGRINLRKSYSIQGQHRVDVGAGHMAVLNRVQWKAPL